MIQLNPINYFALGIFKWYFIFFVIDYLIAKYKESILNYKAIYSCFIALFPIVAVTWRYGIFPYYFAGEPSFTELIRHFLIVNNIRGKRILIKSLLFTYQYLSPFTGIAFSFLVIGKLKQFYKALSWLGQRSIEIYLGHFMFTHFGIFDISFSNILFRLIFSVVYALSGALLVAYVLKKSRILALLFYGQGEQKSFTYDKDNRQIFGTN